MRHASEPEFVGAGKWKGQARIVVGIDPGLDKHGVAALVAGSCYRLARREIPNNVGGMQLLARLLTEWRAQAGGPLQIGMEEVSAYGEALACYLDRLGLRVVVVSALKVARFKEVMGADANDVIDAEAVARLLIAQPDAGRAPAREAVGRDPHGAQHQRLRQLSRRHASWTRERVIACNELHAVLRMAWLADYQGFFSRLDGVAALAFWQAYPTPAEASEADGQEMAALLRRVSRGRIDVAASRAKADRIQALARLLVAALGGKETGRWSGWAEDIRALSRLLAELVCLLKEVRTQMKALLEEIESPLPSMKGLGPVIASTIHGEMLSVDRFATADRFARYNGTAPREDSSGRRPRHVKNYRCNKRLKRALMQLALNAPRYHELSRAYTEQLRSRGITGGAARLRLARRLSGIVYAMLRQNREYDSEVHLRRKRQVA